MPISQGIETAFLFEISARISDPAPVVVGQSESALTVVTVMSGQFVGPAMRGRVLPVAGGDWVSVKSDGSMKLDVRLVLETDDNDLIYMTYQGVGIAEQTGTLRLVTAPMFSTSSVKYDFLNRIQAVAVGKSQAGTVEYRVFKVL